MNPRKLFLQSKICCCCWLVTKSCPTLCDPVDYSPPGSSVHGISQARILEWVAIAFSRGSSWPRDWTPAPALAGRFFTTEPPGKPSVYMTEDWIGWPWSSIPVLRHCHWKNADYSMLWDIMASIEEIHLSDLQFSHLKSIGAGLVIFKDTSAVYNPVK